MDYSEKLNYLFELTHAEGKELAACLNLTPPQISKMRKGIRGLPKSEDSAMDLARFFARRCSSDFQREALAKTIRVTQIRDVDNENTLTDLLLDWLSDDQDPDEYAAKRADDFLRRFGTLFSDGRYKENDSETGRQLTSETSSFFTYFGKSGKRLALMTFLKYILQLKKVYTINVLTDEDIDWQTEDAEYSVRLQDTMMKLTEQGCRFCRISGPIMDLDQAFASLNRWLPLYMTGKATSYYYKRMRDSLNRITLYVVPNVAALFSFSVGIGPHQNAVTFFTVDEKTSASMAIEFDNYLALCEPIMNVYSADNFKQLHICMNNYEGYAANCIQQSDTPSFITLPWEVALSLHEGDHPEEKERLLASLAKRYRSFTANLENYFFVDIIRLANVDDIMNQRVILPASCVLGGDPQYYTPTGYLQHLRNVLYLLNHRKNYHVVIRDPGDTDSNIIYVKEGFCAILAKDASPFSIFEVSERYLVDAFTEYLRRLTPGAQNAVRSKQEACTQIQNLISALESHIPKANGR